eukprot:COSAG01_NODE_9066_length_2565_cov_1.377534_2_plen_680_part_00
MPSIKRVLLFAATALHIGASVSSPIQPPQPVCTSCAEWCAGSCSFGGPAVNGHVNSRQLQNITVYRMTAANVTDLDFKNTGDPAGDLDFNMDERAIPLVCRHSATASSTPDCIEGNTHSWLLDSRLVYLQWVIEVDGMWGPYQMCNLNLTNPATGRAGDGKWSCRGASFDSGNFTDRELCGTCERTGRAVGWKYMNASSATKAHAPRMPSAQCNATFQRVCAGQTTRFKNCTSCYSRHRRAELSPACNGSYNYMSQLCPRPPTPSAACNASAEQLCGRYRTSPAMHKNCSHEDCQRGALATQDHPGRRHVSLPPLPCNADALSRLSRAVCLHIPVVMALMSDMSWCSPYIGRSHGGIVNAWGSVDFLGLAAMGNGTWIPTLLSNLIHLDVSQTSKAYVHFYDVAQAVTLAEGGDKFGDGPLQSRAVAQYLHDKYRSVKWNGTDGVGSAPNISDMIYQVFVKQTASAGPDSPLGKMWRDIVPDCFAAAENWKGCPLQNLTYTKSDGTSGSFHGIDADDQNRVYEGAKALCAEVARPEWYTGCKSKLSALCGQFAKVISPNAFEGCNSCIGDNKGQLQQAGCNDTKYPQMQNFCHGVRTCTSGGPRVMGCCGRLLCVGCWSRSCACSHCVCLLLVQKYGCTTRVPALGRNAALVAAIRVDSTRNAAMAHATMTSVAAVLQG